MEILHGTNQTSMLRRLKADLRQDPRKAKILMGLVPLLGFAVIPLLFGGYPSKRMTPRSVPTEVAAEELPPVQVDLDLRAELAQLVRGLHREEVRLWTNDDAEPAFGASTAFGSDASGAATQAGSRRDLNATSERELAESLMPSGTYLSSSAGNLAMIDGKPYREGDEVESFQVVEIGLRSLILRGEHGDYSLEIPIGDGEQP